MPYTVILFVTRKPGLSISDFQHHWENVNIPLLKHMTGEDFPLAHTRHYVERDTSLPASPANVLKGSQEDFGYDAVTIWTFADQGHWERFKGKWKHGEVHEALERDENAWMDKSKLKAVVVGDTRSTGRDGREMGWRFVGSV